MLHFWEIIETYWNVNLANFFQTPLYGVRNNRNILECKSAPCAALFSMLHEIIETYWNVNGTGISYVSTSGGEIIETYWNVNDFYFAKILNPF
mgnify:FL=1